MGEAVDIGLVVEFYRNGTKTKQNSCRFLRDHVAFFKWVFLGGLSKISIFSTVPRLCTPWRFLAFFFMGMHGDHNGWPRAKNTTEKELYYMAIKQRH